MSSAQDEAPCPTCGSAMGTYTQNRPFDQVSGECLFCGFHYWTEIGQATLSDVNASRKQQGLPKIKKLTKQTMEV